MKFLNILFYVVLTIAALHAQPTHRIEKRDLDDFLDEISDFFINVENWFYSVANFYQATDNALSYMISTTNVTVTEQDFGYYFNGPGNSKALIFYQGAKVDEKAYAEILFKLAEQGIDCFVVKMPIRMAILGMNKASKIIKRYRNTYTDWYIGGHSLGGAVAAMYAASNDDDIKGLVMLAAYSTRPLPEGMKVISLTASNDSVLNWNKYNNYLSNLPNDYVEVNIEGGNHAQFGDYGEQTGDGVATISLVEQHQVVINTILNEFNPN